MSRSSALVAEMGPELSARVEDVVITGECTCGCSSVQLSSTAAPLPEPTVSRLSDTGRSDSLTVKSMGCSPDRHRIDVVLHVVAGRLHELEIFDSYAGEGVAVDPAGLTALESPQVG